MKKRFMVVILFLATLLLGGCGNEGAPNLLSNLATCSSIELDQCTEDRDSFPADTKKIYVTAKLNNATYGTRSSCELRYLEGSGDDSVTVDFTVDMVTEELSSYLVFYFSNEEDWPKGEYEVTVNTDTPGSERISKKFRIE